MFSDNIRAKTICCHWAKIRLLSLPFDNNDENLAAGNTKQPANQKIANVSWLSDLII